MRAHWTDVINVFDLLAYMVKRADPDGIDLYFTMYDDHHKSKHTSPLLQILKKRSQDGNSNIRRQLGNILRDYEERLERTSSRGFRWNRVRPSRQPRQRTLYVFTDGVWQPSCDVTRIIKDVVDSLEKHNVYREQFGIQFIRFGNDPVGINRLNHLDSGLKLSMYVLFHDYK